MPRDKKTEAIVEDVDESEESDEDYEPDPSEADDRERDGNDAAQHEASQKDKGRMIKDEQDEIITIRMSSFARYFRYMGGCCAIFPYMVILVLFIFVNMAVTYYI